MVDFTVNVVSRNGEKKVPVEIAGMVMIDIQELLAHVGCYLMAKELRLQGAPNSKLQERLKLYIDPSGGITLNASAEAPEEKTEGGVVEEAVALMEKTLDNMGNMTGGYWMEDNFTDAVYRNDIIWDLVKLYEDINSEDGYVLRYGSSAALKDFGKVDVDKLQEFIGSRGNTSLGATVGMISKIDSRAHGSVLRLNSGVQDQEVRLNFTDNKCRLAAEAAADTVPTVVAGRLKYDDNGILVSIDSAGGIAPLPSIKYMRVISSSGDVDLKSPVEAKVLYANGRWTLRNEALGIDASGDSWDSAVEKFHDYFVFLWTEYTEKADASLSDEEKEVKRALLALMT
jgi:hypothetical protein